MQALMAETPEMADRERFFREQRRCFPGLAVAPGSEVVHLYNAAGSEMPEAAIEAMAQVMRSGFCNEGVIFRRLEASRALPGAARAATADLLGASPDEIGFGASTTQNLFFITRALAGCLRPGDRILVSEACHEANVAPWLALKDRGVDVDFIPMRADTHLDYEWLEANLDRRTRIVTVGASSNATGTVHDVARVVRAARQVSALVSLDAAHFVPHHPVDVAALDVDLLFFSAYKCFGPHLGAFYVRRRLCAEIPPFGIEPPPAVRETAARFEAGTRSFEGLAGWLAAVVYLEQLGRRFATEAPGSRATEGPPSRAAALATAMGAISAWEEELTAYADARLSAVPGIEIYAQGRPAQGPRLGVFTFNLEGIPAADVAWALEQAGVEAVLGHNGAIRTMARFAGRHGGTGIRLSIAHYNTRDDVDRAVDCLLSLRS